MASATPKPKFSTEAKRDLISIRDYLINEKESPRAALKIIEIVLNRVDKLQTFPKAGKLLSTKVNFLTNYRYITAENYLIFYRYEKNQILVDRIIHGRRDYIAILFPDLNSNQS